MGKKYRINNFRELADFIAKRDPNGLTVTKKYQELILSFVQI